MNRTVDPTLERFFVFLLFGVCPAVLAGGDTSITVPMAAAVAVEKAAADALTLAITGDGQYLDVAVRSKHQIRGCPPNLVHWAAHGPDPSEIMPWQITSRRFPDKRSIPVCGHALTLDIVLVSPVVTGTGDGARFTGGTLIASIRQRTRPSLAIAR